MIEASFGLAISITFITSKVQRIETDLNVWQNGKTKSFRCHEKILEQLIIYKVV